LGIVEARREGADDDHEADADREAQRGERGAPRPAAKL
jgi:hypothetical protein